MAMAMWSLSTMAFFRFLKSTFCIFSFVLAVQNRCKNRRKIVSGGCLGEPPGPSQDLPDNVHPHFQASLTMDEKNKRFWKFPVSSREVSGDLGGSEKFARNRFFAKKWRSRCDLLSIFVQKASFHAFCTIARSFAAKNR